MKLKNLHVTKNNIFVEPIYEKGDVASGKLVQPDQYEDKVETGIVVAIGEGVEDIKIGTEIIFAKYAPVSVTIEDKLYLVMKKEDILGYA